MCLCQRLILTKDFFLGSVSVSGLALQCIATPNAKIGAATRGISMYNRFTDMLQTSRQEVYAKKREVCKIIRQLNSLNATKKGAEDRVRVLVSSWSGLF